MLKAARTRVAFFYAFTPKMKGAVMGLKEYFAEFHRGREGQHYEPDPFGRLGQGRWVEDKPHSGLVAQEKQSKPKQSPSGINLLRHKPRQRPKPPKPISEAAVDHLSQEMIGALENNDAKKLEGIRNALAAYQEKDQKRILKRTVLNWPGNKEWRKKSKAAFSQSLKQETNEDHEFSKKDSALLRLYLKAFMRGAAPPILAPINVYEKLFDKDI